VQTIGTTTIYILTFLLIILGVDGVFSAGDMMRADDYRVLAEESRRQAEKSTSVDDRAWWSELADILQAVACEGEALEAPKSTQ
jgi:hypothetical protein